MPLRLSLVLPLSVILVLAPVVTLAEDDPRNIVRWAKGKYIYRMASTGQATGEEDWHLTVHPDGSRTMRATNFRYEGDVHRTVVLRVAETFRPLDLYAAYWVNGAWSGTGLFAVTGDTMSAVVETRYGRIEQTLTVPEHFSFIPHPLSTNAWLGWYYDRDKGGPQTITVYDLLARVQGPAVIGPMYQQTLAYLGEQNITVPAGTFTTQHYKVDDAVDLYLTGQDALMVRFEWEPADRIFELTELEQGGYPAAPEE